MLKKALEGFVLPLAALLITLYLDRTYAVRVYKEKKNNIFIPSR